MGLPKATAQVAYNYNFLLHLSSQQSYEVGQAETVWVLFVLLKNQVQGLKQPNSCAVPVSDDARAKLWHNVGAIDIEQLSTKSAVCGSIEYLATMETAAESQTTSRRHTRASGKPLLRAVLWGRWRLPKGGAAG